MITCWKRTASGLLSCTLCTATTVISIWFLKGKSNFHQKLKLRAISSFFLTRPRLSRWRLKEDRENNPFSVWSLKKKKKRRRCFKWKKTNDDRTEIGGGRMPWYGARKKKCAKIQITDSPRSSISSARARGSFESLSDFLFTSRNLLLQKETRRRKKGISSTHEVKWEKETNNRLRFSPPLHFACVCPIPPALNRHLVFRVCVFSLRVKRNDHLETSRPDAATNTCTHVCVCKNRINSFFFFFFSLHPHLIQWWLLEERRSFFFVFFFASIVKERKKKKKETAKAQPTIIIRYQ